MMRDLGEALVVERSRVRDSMTAMQITMMDTITITGLTPKHVENGLTFGRGIRDQEFWNHPWAFTDKSIVDLNGTRSLSH
jgi:hypothetical protein